METKYICIEPGCIQQFQTAAGLSRHFRRAHGYSSSKKLYVALFLDGITPTCKCGCGEETKFLDITRGFSSYKVGHSSRVANNFQTKKSVENSLATRRAMLKTGEWKPFICNDTGTTWHKGQTKETDERLQRILTTEEKARRSETMKRAWKDGRITPLVGAQHPAWKGGVSGLVTSCHANRRLYTEWKYPLLVAAGFACSRCGVDRGPFEVHHDKERMAAIVHKLAMEHGWNDHYALAPAEESHELKSTIVEAVATYHIDNRVSGLVLCEACHELEHNSYNF